MSDLEVLMYGLFVLVVVPAVLFSTCVVMKKWGYDK